MSLYKYEDCSFFFFLKWLEQEAHLLRSRQNTKDEELSYHGGKTRLMSLSESINKTKLLLSMFLPVNLVTLVYSWPISFSLNTSFLKDRLA